MNSERKAFLEWAESENPLLVEEAETDSQFHKDILDYMFMGWHASASRQGYKLVPVDANTGIDYEYMEQNYKAK